jgi:alkylhydroperoxidase family enzyme
MVAAIEADHTTAPIIEQDRAMLDYVVQLTRDARRVNQEYHERLRGLGFDD